MSLYQSMTCPWIRLLGVSVLVLLLAPVPTGASQEMGLVYVVKSDPSSATTLFAGAEHGLFKSVDAGATWTATALTQGDYRAGDRPGGRDYRVCGNRFRALQERGWRNELERYGCDRCGLFG